MKFARAWTILPCALLLPLHAAAATDMFLQIKNAQGATRVVQCPGGACLIDQLEPGQYTVLICDAAGKVIPSDARLEYTVVSTRERGSGMATGRRMHKPISITKEWGRGAPATNAIAIDEPGVHLAIGLTAGAVEAAVAKATKTRSNIQNN